jgi:hypothetical protein
VDKLPLDRPEAVKALLSSYLKELDVVKNDYMAKLESWYGVELDDLDAVNKVTYMKDDVMSIIEDGIEKALKKAALRRKHQDTKNKPVTWKAILNRKPILKHQDWRKTIIPALETLQAAGRIHLELPYGFDNLQDVPLKNVKNIKLDLLN